MIETVSTLEIRKKLGDLLNRVALRHDQFIVERKGKPLAAMVPVEKLKQMERFARIHLKQALRRKVAKISPEKAERLADEAKHQTRKRK